MLNLVCFCFFCVIFIIFECFFKKNLAVAVGWLTQLNIISIKFIFVCVVFLTTHPHQFIPKNLNFYTLLLCLYGILSACRHMYVVHDEKMNMCFCWASPPFPERRKEKLVVDWILWTNLYFIIYSTSLMVVARALTLLMAPK